MEPLGGATTVIAVIQVAAQVVKLCGGYIGEVKAAADEIERFKSKASILHDVLIKLKECPATANHQAVIKDCLTELESIKQSLQPSTAHKRMKRFGIRALKWPFSKKEADEKIARLDGYRNVFGTILQLDSNIRIIDSEEEHCLDTKLAYVADASLSEQRHRHHPCLENTRVQVLQEVEQWARTSTSQSIFWLRGMAGLGKSTVAISLAERLKQVSPTVATFFFRRGFGDLGNARKLLTTLVRQLAYVSAPYRCLVVAAIKAEPDLGRSLDLRGQYEKLIVSPLDALQSATNQVSSFFLVIDALDECGQEQQSYRLSDLELLLHLFATTKSMSSLPLRIVVTSRPEYAIERGFESMPSILYHDLDLYRRPRQEVDADLTTFFRHELEQVRCDRNISLPWPSEPEVTTLVSKAAGLFIFADTACRYIAGPSQADSRARLEKVCSFSFNTDLGTQPLDRMYTTVLENAFLGEYTSEEQKRNSLRYRRVVGSIVLLFAPLPIAELHRLLQCPELGSPDEIRQTLRDLHAVIDVPRNASSSIEPLHSSFRDFLLDERRCINERFRIQEKQTHQQLASDCLRLLSSSLLRDICQLASPATMVIEIEQTRIDRALPAAVQYSCRYWETHVRECGKKSILLADDGIVHMFLQSHFLHWLEAMSLQQRVSEAVLAMTDLASIVDVSSPKRTSKILIRDNRPHKHQICSSLLTTFTAFSSHFVTWSPLYQNRYTTVPFSSRLRKVLYDVFSRRISQTQSH